MQPELLNGEVVTDWYGLTPNGNAQDGNVYGWDITDQSGNGAVAMAPKVTKNPVSEDCPQSADYASITGATPHIEWCFEDGSGAVASDSSGNGNDGTLENGPTVVQWKSRQVYTL